MNCNICFESIIEEDNMNECYDTKCSCIICTECMIQYINISEIIPKCSCNKIYILQNISRLPMEIIKKYNILCLNFLMNDNLDNVKNIIAKNDVIERLREEKIKFVNTFPEAIQSVINICMKDKLKKINKSNLEVVDKVINSNGRFCMLSYCNGKLDINLKCLKCDTIFCLKCEKNKRDEHICKESDIQNVEYIKNISECPNCKVPIEKSQGCRSMQCANCNTLFDYYTKQKADHGGHNTEIKVKERIKLSNEYKDIYNPEIIKQLILFEHNIPKVDTIRNNKNILNIITEYVSEGKQNTEEYATRISKTYSKNILNEHKYKMCLQKIAEIEDLHENGEITYQKLKQIIS